MNPTILYEQYEEKLQKQFKFVSVNFSKIGQEITSVCFFEKQKRGFT